MKRLLLFLALCFPALAARTTVADVLVRADGSTCSGSLAISWPSFTNTDGFFFAGTIQSPIVNGVLNVSLEPAFVYTVEYLVGPAGCTPTTEFWDVPISATPIPLSAVRSVNPPPPSPFQIPLSYISQSGASPGQCAAWDGSNWAPAACGSGGGIGGSGIVGRLSKFVTNTTTIGSAAAADVVALFSTCSGTQYLGADGSCHNSATGGTVTVVGAGNLTSTDCITGGGSQTIQTPSNNCTVDSNGNLTANSVVTDDAAHSTAAGFKGLTSGGFVIAAADVAGTAVGYVWPTTIPMSFPKSLQITGTVTCPTLAPGSPTTCYQLAWQ